MRLFLKPRIRPFLMPDWIFQILFFLFFRFYLLLKHFLLLFELVYARVVIDKRSELSLLIVSSHVGRAHENQILGVHGCELFIRIDWEGIYELAYFLIRNSRAFWALLSVVIWILFLFSSCLQKWLVSLVDRTENGRDSRRIWPLHNFVVNLLAMSWTHSSLVLLLLSGTFLQITINWESRHLFMFFELFTHHTYNFLIVVYQLMRYLDFLLIKIDGLQLFRWPTFFLLASYNIVYRMVQFTLRIVRSTLGHPGITLGLQVHSFFHARLPVWNLGRKVIMSFLLARGWRAYRAHFLIIYFAVDPHDIQKSLLSLILTASWSQGLVAELGAMSCMQPLRRTYWI